MAGTAKKKAGRVFPPGFEDLEAYAPEWVLGDAMARQRKRAGADLAHVKRFYDALYPEIDRIVAYLKTVKMGGLSEVDRNLYCLASTWMEMSHPLDLGWPASDEADVFPFERVVLWERPPGE